MDIDHPGETEKQLQNGEVDESLYSRQLYVLGHEAMKRMGASNVLVVGLKGLGVEIAKNIALAGVKSLTLFDPEPAAIADLSSQFFLHPQDVGKPRAEVTAPLVAELKGLEELNGAAPRKITVKGPYSFSIGDVSSLGKYQGGGLWAQVKMPKVLQFQPLSEQIKKPELVMSDFAKFDRPAQLHVGV